MKIVDYLVCVAIGILTYKLVMLNGADAMWAAWTEAIALGYVSQRAIIKLRKRGKRER